MLRWLILVTFFLKCLSVNGKYMITFEYVGVCNEKGKNERDIRFENTTYGMVTPEIHEYNTTIVIERNFGVVKAVYEMSKCSTGDGRGCERYMHVTFPDLCKTLTEKNQFYSSLYEQVEPKFTCPLRKGVFKASHVQIDIRLLLKAVNGEQVMEPSYVTKFRLFEGNRQVGCVSVVAKLVDYRPKRKKKTKTFV